MVSSGPSNERDHVVLAIDQALARWQAGNCNFAELRGDILKALEVPGDITIGSDCSPYRTAPPVTRFEYMKREILDWGSRRVVVPMEDLLQLLVEAEEHPC